MKSLEEKEWAPFVLGDIAEIKSGHDIYAQERVDGKIPYITSGATNNGIGYFVSNDNDSKTKNVISVNRNGAVGEAFYHPYTALYGNDCRQVILKGHRNQDVQLFLTQVISNQKETFSYSRKLGTARLQNLHIMLPVNNEGEPDYEYMAEYVQREREKLLCEYKDYIERHSLDEGSIIYIPSLEEKNWQPFLLTDIFPEIERGKRLKSADHIDGQMPYVSSSAENNGVDDFISNDTGVRIFSNCISFANSGSVGSAFYEPFDFVASDHITHLKNEAFSKEVYLFISTMMKKLSSKYDFNREINDYRISREKVLLPVNDDREPDYAYMEQYIKNLMIKKYQQYERYMVK